MSGTRSARTALAALAAAVLAGPLYGADLDRAPRRDDEEPLAPRCLDVAVRGELAVLGQTGGIVTLDVGDPDHPRELGRMGLPATVVDIALDGDRAWLSAGAYGVALVDLERPARPELLQRIDLPGKVRVSLPLGDRLIVGASRHGLAVLDVSDPARARSVATVSTRDEVRALALAGDVLATAEEQAGVRLFDVSRPDNPHELSEVEIDGALDVAWIDRLLLVAAGRHGLVLVDAAEERAPRVVAEVAPERSANTVARLGRFALVGNGTAGLQVVDPFSPGGPATIKSVRLSSRYPAGRLAVGGQVAFVAADLAGIGVVDFEDVDDPRVLLPRSRRMRVSFGD